MAGWREQGGVVCNGLGVAVVPACWSAGRFVRDCLATLAVSMDGVGQGRAIKAPGCVVVPIVA